MFTKITVGMYIMALADDCNNDSEKLRNRLSKTLKWILEPFAVATLIGEGPAFFYTTTTKKNSWVKYPTEEFLKMLSKENLDLLTYQKEPGNPVSINMSEFHIENYAHKEFRKIKIALIVEAIMNNAIEKLGMKGNSQLFERLAFIYLAKQIQHKNELNLNASWWKNVEVPIKTAYSEEVFEKLQSELSLTKEEDKRISDCNFDFTQRELRFSGHTSEELERALDEAYAAVYLQICKLI